MTLLKMRNYGCSWEDMHAALPHRSKGRSKCATLRSSKGSIAKSEGCSGQLHRTDQHFEHGLRHIRYTRINSDPWQRKKGQFPYWLINQNTLCCDMSGCLILKIVEPISSYSGENRHHLRGPSGVASSGLSSGIIKGSHFCGVRPFRRKGCSSRAKNSTFG